MDQTIYLLKFDQYCRVVGHVVSWMKHPENWKNISLTSKYIYVCVDIDIDIDVILSNISIYLESIYLSIYPIPSHPILSYLSIYLSIPSHPILSYPILSIYLSIIYLYFIHPYMI